MKQKVLITTSGVGSALGDLTKYTNKSLVRVGTIPTLAHIIEAYPKGTHFVITLGHFGDHVRDFVSIAYPDLAVEYVTVPKYKGEGSSLGLSLLAAKDVLQCPFVYHAGDTLVSEDIPNPDKNWIGVFQGSDTTNYESWTLQGGTLQLHKRGALETDYIHIGLVGIHEYKSFWKVLESAYNNDPQDSSLNDCLTLSQMIKKGHSMEVIEFSSWKDVGNAGALVKARKELGDDIGDLEKAGERIFIFDTFVVKFFADTEAVDKRVERGRLLNGFVPDIEAHQGNFYRYTYADGDLYSDIAQPEDFKKFLKWAETEFWKEVTEVDQATFSKLCHDFYYEKTQQRIQKFLDSNELIDVEHVINGIEVPTIASMLKMIDFDELSQGIQSRFHGDFILDNILKTKSGYCLIDWRHEFGGLLQGGDRYYDLAKLNHNLTVNHNIISQDLYIVDTQTSNIRVDILRPNYLVECNKVFDDFLISAGYDKIRVELLTGLIWLNMSPLHHHPFNLFLYYFGKLQLWRTIQQGRKSD